MADEVKKHKMQNWLRCASRAGRDVGMDGLSDSIDRLLKKHFPEPKADKADKADSE